MPVTRSALAKQRRPFRLRDIGAEHRSEYSRKPHKPQDARRLRAKPRMERHCLELRQARLEPLLSVLVPEEAGVGEAGAQHALVSGNDRRPAIRCLDVGDDDEEGSRGTVLRHQREILLVRPHRHLADARGQVHERLVDPPEQRNRPFDEPCHLLDQALVSDHRAADRGGEPAQPRQRSGRAAPPHRRSRSDGAAHPDSRRCLRSRSGRGRGSGGPR
jgi:hypothetical protein